MNSIRHMALCAAASVAGATGMLMTAAPAQSQVPPGAIEHIPDHALEIIGQQGGVETYTTVDFVGQSTNPDARGPIVEVDKKTWVEVNTWTFKEVSETRDRVELFDKSRGTTIIIDYTTDLISVIDSSGYHLYDYDITGVTYSLEPVIPDGWTV